MGIKPPSIGSLSLSFSTSLSSSFFLLPFLLLLPVSVSVSPSLFPSFSLSPPLFPPSLLQANPRPPSTVEELLQVHGLQHFSELLIANGYDEIHFITEITEEELQDIGITQASDRSKVRQSHPIILWSHTLLLKPPILMRSCLSRQQPSKFETSRNLPWVLKIVTRMGSCT